MKRFRKLAFASFVFATLCLFPSHVRADTVTFTSSTSFFAALGATPAVTEGYEGVVIGTLIPAGTTLNAITYISFPSAGGGRVGNTFNTIGGGSLELNRPERRDFLPGESFTIAFSLPVTAIGIFFNSGITSPGSLFISTSVGAEGTGGSMYDFGTFYFVGLISDTPFSIATIGATASAATGYNVDNLTFAPAQTAPIPEPTTMLLLGAGLAGLVLRVHRRRSPQNK